MGRREEGKLAKIIAFRVLECQKKGRYKVKRRDEIEGESGKM